jgi:ppGpp synthetase/RelA/SpoT-type nucleotidyltranferase
VAAREPDLEELRRTYSDEWTFWHALAEWVATEVARGVRAAGIKAEVTARAKEIASLIRKAILKQRVEHLDQIRDKAGVRIVVRYPHEVDIVATAVHALPNLDCRKDENKAAAVASDALQYLGRHIDVVARAGPDSTGVEGEPWCEIQIHTLAQTLWAQTCHPLLYKAPFDVPAETERRLWRLVALSEIIDDELHRAREIIIGQAGYMEAITLDALERQFLALVGRDYDAETSRAMVVFLADVYPAEERDGLPMRIDQFAQDNRERLQFVYERNPSSPEPFLLQPESILIFDLLGQHPDALRAAWVNQGLPYQYLETMAAVWGDPLDPQVE